MIGRCVGVVILVASCAAPAAAQSFGALLEQGIFAEETVGDLQTARRIYEDLLRVPGVPRDVALLAERRLTAVRQRLEPPAAGGGIAGFSVELGQDELNSLGWGGLFSDNYDPARPVVIEGTVTRADWINPTMVLYLRDPNGDLWGFTTGPPNAMLLRGMAKGTFKIGDQLRVEGFLALGTDDGCPKPLPSACAQLEGGATHAIATTIRAGGDILFDRKALFSSPPAPARLRF